MKRVNDSKRALARTQIKSWRLIGWITIFLGFAGTWPSQAQQTIPFWRLGLRHRQFLWPQRSAPPTPPATAPVPDPARWAAIPAGTFVMGSPDTEFDSSTNEAPQTTVTLTHDFWMERFEVTQGEYLSLIGTNPASFTNDLNQPVEGVSWFDATNYCGRLTDREQAAGRLPAGQVYRLPTEAEWEYAARAGTTTRFFFGDDLDYMLLPNYAWVSTNSSATTHVVGSRLPNAWGLYDTSGNVWEWCADWDGPYLGGSLIDPVGPPTGTSKIMRGGSWLYPSGDARSATRAYNVLDFASHGIGIRVVLGPPLP